MSDPVPRMDSEWSLPCWIVQIACRTWRTSPEVWTRSAEHPVLCDTPRTGSDSASLQKRKLSMELVVADVVRAGSHEVQEALKMK
jgi:hypothetical protein